MADEVPGTADATPQEESLLETTPAPADGATETPTAPQPTEDQFFDPRELPAELQPAFKKMQASFTRKMQGLSADRQKVELVKKYENDPEFARQFIASEAQRLRIPPADRAPAAGSADSAPPPEMVEAIRNRLAPELKWMAESQAAAAWAAHQMTTRPLMERSEQQERQQRTQQFGELATSLSDIAPTWQEHEDDMNEVLDFLHSRDLRHPKWGSKLELLYNIVTSGSAAKAKAIDAMGNAARARTSTGQPSRSSAPNPEQRIRAAKTSREAFAVAAEEAANELKRQGVAVPT